VSSTPSGALSAHIKVHPNGKFLYASNRTDNSLSIFTIDPATGRLTRVGYQREMIVYPWHFAIDPSGQFLIVANNHAANVLVNRIDAADRNAAAGRRTRRRGAGADVRRRLDAPLTASFTAALPPTAVRVFERS
jgi:6-phosphogluconolactonase (cycloisomerase 2 family)